MGSSVISNGGDGGVGGAVAVIGEGVVKAVHGDANGTALHARMYLRIELRVLIISEHPCDANKCLEN